MDLTAIIDTVNKIPWASTISTSATVVTAFIAYKALKVWREQDRAQHRIDYIDSLLDVTHQFIFDIGPAISFGEFVKMGMRSHIQDWTDEPDEEKITNGAINYIKRRGADDGKTLFDYLSRSKDSAVKIQSLSVKGQVYDFDAFDKCLTSIKQLLHIRGQLSALASIVSSSSLNFDNPEIRSMLASFTALNLDSMNNEIGLHNISVIEFARAQYRQLYGR